MDTVVRIVCIGLILAILLILIDSIKLLIESNEGKKTRSSFNISLKKPRIATKSLIKSTVFFFMLNHGPDLCKIDEEFANVPYYKAISCLLVLGDNDDKN